MSGWGGRRAQAIRKRIKAELPLSCWRCGQPVYPHQPWDVGHVLDRATHPEHAWDETLMRPEHRRCNRAAGQRVTTAKRRRRARAQATTSRAWL